MKTRRFGRTDLQISELCFGGGWVGGILIMPEDDVKREALRIALDAGINWVDTAADYGQGKSEEAIGWLLEEVEAARRPMISTKVRLDLSSGEDFQGQIERSLLASLNRLRMDRIDLFQLHNPISKARAGGNVGVNDVIGADGVADIFEGFRQQGLFGHFGITGLGDAPAIIDVIESGRFDTAQVYYNAINPTAAISPGENWTGHDFSGVLSACDANDMGVMNIRTFAAGILATDIRHGREIPTTEGSDVETEMKRAHSLLKEVGGDYGSRAQFAIRYGLSNHHVSTVVVGLAELAHLKEALAAADLGTLPDDALTTVRTVFENNHGL